MGAPKAKVVSPCSRFGQTQADPYTLSLTPDSDCASFLLQ